MSGASLKNGLVALGFILTANAAMAQEPSPSPSPVSTDIVKSRIDQEIAPAPGSYAYAAQGRRDPFVSLLRPVSDSGPGKRRPGMEGFLIQEVALKGIVKDSKGYTAMLVGTDSKSYFTKVGQRLFDGVITAIDASTVTFRQEVTDPLSSVRSRDVKKTLYPSEEGRQ
jgi:Tfp pilus assembly protein PilP